MPAKTTRSYSRAFTPAPNAKRRAILIDRIPPQLHAAITKKRKQTGESLRSLVLTFLQDWSER